MVHRRDELRASKIMQDRAFANDKIDLVWNSVVEEIVGDGAVTGVRCQREHADETRETPAACSWPSATTPNTLAVRGPARDERGGYILVQEPPTKTSVPGVFAAGDVVDTIYKQAVTAAGMGCKAAIDAERFLEAEGH